MLLIVGLFPLPAQADAGVVRLSTLNWEPYTGEDIPGFGAVSSVVAAALAYTNTPVTFKSYSWKRAIAAAWHRREGIQGYFPGYHCHHDPNTSFVQSNSLGRAPLGFAYHKNGEIPDWKTLQDFRGLRIGYVTGYASTDEFEELEKSGIFTVYRSINDESNLHKLLMGQLDAVLIDGLIFQYLMKINPILSERSDLLQFHHNSLGKKELYVCLRDDVEGRKIRDMINTGLERLDSNAIMEQYFLKSFSTIQ